MALIFQNEYMVIKWHLSSSLLKVIWSQASECMSLLDYHQCLLTLGNYVDNFQPNIFVFDAYDFNYRATTELDVFFFKLTQSKEHSEIALIASRFFLGRHTISRIAEKHFKVKVFETQTDLIQWYKTKVS